MYLDFSHLQHDHLENHIKLEFYEKLFVLVYFPKNQLNDILTLYRHIDVFFALNFPEKLAKDRLTTSII
jgi:hypothetical protein